MADIERADCDGATSLVNSVGVKDSQNNIKLVVDMGDKGTIEIPLTGKLVVDQQQNSDSDLPPDADDKEQQNSDSDLPPDADDKDQQNSDSALADEQDKQFLTEMRGWMVTVATLFVTLAFQAAMQPPGWMARGDWYRIIAPTHYGTTTGASSVSSHADRPAMPASPPSPPPPPAITVGQAWRAGWYVSLNAATFAMALTLVVTLLLMTKQKNARITMVAVKIFVVVLACCVASTFVLGTSDVQNIRTWVALIITFFAQITIVYFIYTYYLHIAKWFTRLQKIF